MNFNKFQELSRRTQNSGLDWREAIINSTLGLVGEASEVAEHIKKHLYHNKELNVSELVLELSDNLFYIAWLADLLGYDLDDVAQMNVDKLAARWPNGFMQTEG